MQIKKYIKTAQMTMGEKTNGGIFYLLPMVFIKLVYLIPLIYLWRVVLQNGADVGMSLAQMLSYTIISAVLSEMLVVKTVASGWIYEGIILSLYERPIPIFGHIISQTLGGWVPMFMLFSIPMLILSLFLGIVITPASAWFFVSLLLCISLGFAVDFIFACLVIKLRSMEWLVHVIRMAIISLFSGTVIPFKLLPFEIGKILALQPFASLGGAPLSIFTGISEPIGIILIQIFWNFVLWPLALLFFKKSQEDMMSYGG